MVAFLSIHNHNPFPFFAFLCGLFLALRFYAFHHRSTSTPHHSTNDSSSSIKTHHSDSRLYEWLVIRCPHSLVRIVWCLLTLFLLLTLWFEYYFSTLHCKVSDDYYSSNLLLFRQVIGVLQDERMIFWLDFATLLNFVRKQYAFNAWEQDSDLSMLKPGTSISMINSHTHSRMSSLSPSLSSASSSSLVDASSSAQLNSVDELRDRFAAYGFKSFYFPKRELLQIYKGEARSGPHVDLWLWTPQRGSDHRVWLSSPEDRMSYNPRLASEVFPLVNMTWPGVFQPISPSSIQRRGRQLPDLAGTVGGTYPNSVLIPHLPKTVCVKEYEAYGTSVFTPTVFKGDCLHNMVSLRFLPFLW